MLPVLCKVFSKLLLELVAGAADPGDSVLSGGSLTGSTSAGASSQLTLTLQDAFGNPVSVNVSEVEVLLTPL